MASLWTLQQGCLDLLHRPLLERQLAGGLVDHLRILVELDAFPQKRFKTFQTQMKKKSWLPRLLAPSEEGLLEINSAEVHPKHESEVRWFAAESLSTAEESPKSGAGLRSVDAAGVRAAVERFHSELQIRFAEPDYRAAAGDR